MAAVFDDAATIRHALNFEAALAQALAAEELIDAASAQAIVDRCARIDIDAADLATRAALAGTLAIPLVATLRHTLTDDAARATHRGATSQDLADTVLALQLRAASACLTPELARLHSGLRQQATRYANLPCVGRTLLQDALPIAFGLRLAQALAGIDSAWARLDADIDAHARLQFGGAAGTRAGLSGRGAAIAAHIGKTLGLPTGPPWHAQRIGIGAIASDLGLLCGAVGKFARDVALLAQNTIGEAHEPALPGRGGSSAMAHKRNPTGCQVALSAAIRAPGLVASILCGLPQEEERGLGGWQAEGPVIADLFLLAAGSVAAMADIAEGLDVNEGAVARNLDAAGIGSDLGESNAIITEIISTLHKA